jgi:hypothetical protein
MLEIEDPLALVDAFEYVWFSLRPGLASRGFQRFVSEQLLAELESFAGRPWLWHQVLPSSLTTRNANGLMVARSSLV